MDLIRSITEEGPTHGSDLLTAMVVAEYQTLRVEIGRFQDHQQQTLNFGFLVLAAIVAGLGSVLAGSAHPLVQVLRDYHLVFLVVPLIFLFLGALFAERTIRIMRVGDYLDREVRQLVKEVLNKDVLRWEDHRRSPRLFAKRVFRVISLGRLLDIVRWVGFIGPIGLSLILLSIAQPQLEVNEWFLLALDVIALGITCMFAVKIDESSGVPRPG